MTPARIATVAVFASLALVAGCGGKSIGDDLSTHPDPTVPADSGPGPDTCTEIAPACDPGDQSLPVPATQAGDIFQTFPGDGATSAYSNLTMETFQQARPGQGCMNCHTRARLSADFMWSVQMHAYPEQMTLPGTPARFFHVTAPLPRAEAVAAGGALIEALRSSMAALLGLYRFIAWSRDNDFVSMRDVLQKEKQVKRQRGLARNDEVRVVRGMFAGKMGVVQEIDARGGIRLLVGKLAVKVAADDVVKP